MNKIYLFFSVFSPIAQGLIIFYIGSLLCDHLESFITLVSRKPEIENTTDSKAKTLVRKIGWLCKFIGIFLIIMTIIGFFKMIS